MALVALAVAAVAGVFTAIPQVVAEPRHDAANRGPLDDPAFLQRERERLFGDEGRSSWRDPIGEPPGPAPEHAARPGRDDAFEGGPWDSGSEQVRQRFERSAAYRRSPEGRAARERSRTAHGRRDREEALALARDRFPEAARQPPFKPLVLSRGERVVGYQGRFNALVELAQPNGAATTALAESTFPLRSDAGSGEPAPVSLALQERDDGYEPNNPVSPLRISKRVAAGVRLADLRITAADSSDPVALSDNTLFFANAGGADRDLDLMVTPDPLGVEFAWQLRSERSPELLSLRFDLPDGAAIRLGSTANLDRAEIVRDGKTVATVAPPRAYDAKGQPVRASYSVRGSSLLVEVRHRAEDLAYPVLVDPAVDHYLTDSQNQPLHDCSGGWVSPGNRWQFAVVQGSGWSWGEECEGLYVVKWGFGSGDWAQWYLRSVNVNTFFERSHYWASHYLAGGWRSCILEAGWTAAGDWDHGRWYHYPPYTPPTYAPQNFVATSPWMYAQGLEYSGDPYYRGDGCVPHNNNFKDHFFTSPQPDNYLLFGHYIHSGSDWGAPSYGVLRGATVYHNDNDSPSLTASHSVPPGGWARRSTPTVAASATEAGLGVKAFTLHLQTTDGSWRTVTRERNCEGGTKYPCQPPEWSQTIGYDTDDVDPGAAGSQPSPEGINTAQLAAWDATGKASNVVSWPLKVDRSGPAIEATGSVVDAGTVRDVPYVLDLDVSDGSGSGASARSGVQSVTVSVNGDTVRTVTPDCTNVPDNCKPEPFQVSFDGSDMAEGDHRVEVTAIDRVGNTTTQQVASFKVKHAATADIGPGEVNLLNGTFTTTAADASFPGFSASLALSRTYSSRNPAANVDPMFGPGWLSSLPVPEAAAEYVAIGVSGDGTATLTMADGLRLGFKPAGGTAYGAPAGFKHLRLTKPGEDSFRLADTDGNVITFARPDPDRKRFVPTQVDHARRGRDEPDVAELRGGGRRHPAEAGPRARSEWRQLQRRTDGGLPRPFVRVRI
uniref:Putative large secreted protein n=1 Tax=uncultured bacterium NM_1663 TaxID=1630017 RepID=A0A0E3JHW9_9BACT|nr:putative large secreted protein [uncultured bacterium NM_1663]